MAFPRPLEALIEAFARFPGIGRRTAERLSLHLLRTGSEEARAFLEAARGALEAIRPCSACGAVAETDPCPLCSDPARADAPLCVVEETTDMEAIERSGAHQGRYHVLGGRLNPAEGLAADRLRLAELLDRVARDEVAEVIIATNPDVEGDGTASWLAGELEGRGVGVTRLARGLPSGSHLEYLNQRVIEDAFSGRRPV